MGVLSQLDKAIQLATMLHAGQVDKNDRPYILHPLRVMANLHHADATVRIIAVLLDVVEDTGMGLTAILEAFGHEVAAGVDAVTRAPGEQYFDFIHRAAKHPDGWIVKRADLVDNLGRGGIPKSLRERYEKALKILDARSIRPRVDVVKSASGPSTFFLHPRLGRDERPVWRIFDRGTGQYLDETFASQKDAKA